MLVRNQLETQLASAKNEIEVLKSHIENEGKEKFGELEKKIENLQNELSEKEAKILTVSEELKSLHEGIKKKENYFEEEKQSMNKSHYVERNKLAADVKLLQNEKSEVEQTLAIIKKDFQKLQGKAEDSSKRSKDKIDSLESTLNEEKLSKDREIKLQSDEIVKLRETLQKIKSKHSCQKVRNFETKL